MFFPSNWRMQYRTRLPASTICMRPGNTSVMQWTVYEQALPFVTTRKQKRKRPSMSNQLTDKQIGFIFGFVAFFAGVQAARYIRLLHDASKADRERSKAALAELAALRAEQAQHE
jgi:hypothetical protein